MMEVFIGMCYIIAIGVASVGIMLMLYNLYSWITGK